MDSKFSRAFDEDFRSEGIRVIRAPVRAPQPRALAQCCHALPQPAVDTASAHRPEGDEKWFLEDEKPATQGGRKRAAERPLKDTRDECNSATEKGIRHKSSIGTCARTSSRSTRV